jgi:hypothetical protein
VRPHNKISVVSTLLQRRGPSSAWRISDVPVNLQMQATGGVPPYTWSGGQDGLSISSTTGLISGTPKNRTSP